MRGKSEQTDGRLRKKCFFILSYWNKHEIIGIRINQRVQKWKSGNDTKCGRREQKTSRKIWSAWEKDRRNELMERKENGKFFNKK